MFRSDRRGSIGGGVLMYVHEDLPAIPCQDMIDLEIEDSMWISVKLNVKDTLLAGIVYRTQQSSDENNIKIIDTVKHIPETQGYTHILLMGDYNFPEIKWEENTVSGSEQSTAATFFDTTQDAYLYQHIVRPTRQRSGPQSSTLDLVFSNEQYVVDNVTHLAPLGYSDHESLRWSYMVDNVTHLAPLGYSDHESLRWSYMVDNVTHLAPLGYSDHESLRWSYMVDNVTHLAPLGYRDHESLWWSYMVDNVTHLAPLGYSDHESLRWSYMVDNVTHLAPLAYIDHESLRWSYMVDNVTHLAPLGYSDHESLRWSYMVDNVTHLAPLDTVTTSPYGGPTWLTMSHI